MKPLSTKNRNDAQDSQQLDFLSSIPAPIPPMKPIETSQDGTLPLPLSNEPSHDIPPRPIFPMLHKEPAQPEPPPDPVADVFDSDPFFNPAAPLEQSDEPSEQPEEPSAEPEEDVTAPPTPEPAEEIYLSEDVPFEIEPTDPIEEEAPEQAEPEQAAPEPMPAPQPLPTAEERLLGSIVNEPAGKRDEPQARIYEDKLNLLRTELDSAMEVACKAAAARDKSQKDLHALKTRFAALETELAATQATLTHANQLRTQTETRFTEAEKQWTEKLNHLRRLLDEVEDTRDEASQKKVSKLLFIGTVVTSVIAILFAYLIGTNQSASQKSTEETPASPSAMTPPVPPMDDMRPPPAPALTPEAPAPAAPMLNTGISTPAPAPAPAPPPKLKKPAAPAAAVNTEWPALTGNRWNTSASAKELKVVFSYGLFTSGSTLSATAKEDLKAISASLKGKPYRIEIEGHTDAVKAKKSKGSDNHAIGLARAKAVASYLTGSCGLPASMLSTSSAGESNPPHPNTTAATQQRNRTVVLKITK